MVALVEDLLEGLVAEAGTPAVRDDDDPLAHLLLELPDAAGRTTEPEAAAAR